MNYPLTFILIFLISSAVIVSTFILSIRLQLILFWAYLPFVDLLKRMVFLDPNASSTNMYAILFTQDLFLLAILSKVIINIINQTVRVKIQAVDIAVLMFALISAASAIATSSVPITARIAAIGMRVWPMITYFLAASYLSDPDSLKRIWRLTLILGIMVALYGIRQFFFGVLPFEAFWFENASTSTDALNLQFSATLGVFRTYGTLDSHDSYGIFLGICLIFAWVWKRNLGLVKWLLIFLVLAFGLVLSFTRLTWLMPVLAAGFIFFFTYSRVRPFFSLRNLRKPSLLLLFITSSFGIIYIALSFLHGVRFFSATSNSYLERAFDTGTLEARLRGNRFLSENTDFSIFGNGLASSAYFARKFEYVSTVENYHNVFLDMISEMGVLGLFFFLVLLYFLFKAGITSIVYQRDPNNRMLLVGLFGLILAMMMVSHFNNAVFYFGRAIPVYFWSMTGILAHFERPIIQFFTAPDKASFERFQND